VGLEAVKIHGHRVLLAGTNDVFQAMFENEFLERRTGEVIIPDIEPEVFIELLRYLYCDKSIITKENLVALYGAANKYLIQDLKGLCLQAIDETNALYVYKTNEQSLKFPEILEKCKDVITKKPFSTLGQSDLKNLSGSELKDFLLNCNHRLSIRDKFSFIDKWQKGKGPAINTAEVEVIYKEIDQNTIYRVYLWQKMKKESTFDLQVPEISQTYFKLGHKAQLVGLGIIRDSSINKLVISLSELNTGSNRRLIKRKVLAKQNDCDEIDEVYFDQATIKPQRVYTLKSTTSLHIMYLMLVP
jgi:hypothetical protein